ncbi:phosphate acetyltransferase [uncultured Campylobacter sp.]|uniref:phosphate acetyltransferase n=1 Tax=uncultured Campylobacter sp. TaxID=218934 RepID=UPI0026238461|nr:phosphate acetyltransferase [uncultured Campylobacter sp.]
MKSLYLIRTKDEDLSFSISEKMLQSIAQKYKNICIFTPVFAPVDERLLKELISKFKLKQEFNKTYAFSEEEALESYVKDKNIFLQGLISAFEKLKEEYDFVFVLGLSSFGVLGLFEMNVKFAKELNTPIFAINFRQDKTVNNYLSEKLDCVEFVEINDKFDLNKFYEVKEYNFVTQNRFSYQTVKLAKKNKKKVVLPESDDDRILQAAAILLQQELVDVVLLGDEALIKRRAKELNINIHKAEILNNQASPLHSEFAKILYEARKHKGMSENEAKELVKDRTYFGTMLVHTNKADAMVSGASTTTAETIRPALQFVKTKDGVSVVSGMFFMLLEDRVLVFADCAVTTNPTPEQLAEIAYSSANTAKAFGMNPKVAMLSYSTGSSGSGVSVDAIKEALAIAKERYPDLEINGPLQFDAAIDIKTAKSKMPNCSVAGHANVFIFPDLNAANICYKAVQRTANTLAVGPILQGLKKPINDLSRGCLVDDIVNTVILSAIQAQSK